MNRLTIASAASLVLALAGACLAQNGGAGEPPKGAEKPAVSADAPKLKIGDPAPALSIAKWVKGEPVTGFEKGRVYVVEFWATWCGPCIASMPHLTEIQKQYKSKGVAVIGVTSQDKRGNSLERVEKMVADKGDTIGYTIAWDPERKTGEAYMKAAGRSGIPCSFVVDAKGNIAYIGHPMELDAVLDDVVAGTWDYTNGPKKIEAMEKARDAIFEAMEQDPKQGLSKLKEFEAAYPKAAKSLGSLKFHILLATGDEAGASAAGADLVTEAIANKNPMTLNEVAWTIVDPNGQMTKKDLALAFRAAEEAAKLTEHKEPAILDTLARVYFLKGDRAKAIEIQKKAIALAPEDLREELEPALKEYEAAPKN